MLPIHYWVSLMITMTHFHQYLPNETFQLQNFPQIIYKKKIKKNCELSFNKNLKKWVKKKIWKIRAGFLKFYLNCQKQTKNKNKNKTDLLLLTSTFALESVFRILYAAVNPARPAPMMTTSHGWSSLELDDVAMVTLNEKINKQTNN